MFGYALSGPTQWLTMEHQSLAYKYRSLYCVWYLYSEIWGRPHMRIQFRRARPRMYRSRCFASKYSCAAHLKIYKYYAPLHRSELKMFADFDNLLDQDVSKSFAKCKLINKKKESKVSPYIWYFILREIHVWWYLVQMLLTYDFLCVFLFSSLRTCCLCFD